ncbi:MAG TPA: prepilin peptidase [Candidatus Acidoferrum sp.]|nr:prepilin peptidase [Candidatus Acidoferrum sp.]
MPTQLLIPVAAVIGAIIGSFLNVVIVRVPRHESLVTPRSRCPACGTELCWFDNIPVLSFLALRGSCRACGAAISWRYPTIEGLTALLFAAAAWRSTSIADLLVAWLFLAALVAIAGIDLEHQIIPDRITLPGIVVGFLTSFLGTRASWLDSLLGILAIGGILLAVIIVSGGGMGGGDVKLGAMMGAFLGYKLALLALFLAVISGGCVALALLFTGIRRRKDPIPFGPFLAMSAAIALLWGETILTWYLTAFSF